MNKEDSKHVCEDEWKAEKVCDLLSPTRLRQAKHSHREEEPSQVSVES